jgi:signal peptidase
MSRRASEGPDRSQGRWRRFAASVLLYSIPVILVISAAGYTYAALIWHVNPPVVAVQGSSMTPSLKAGDLVFLAPAHPSTLKKGDIIAVRVPTPARVTYGMAANVVRRIVRVEHRSQGLLFVTRADHSSGNDVFTTPSHNIVGRLKFVVPALGYAFVFAQSIEGVIFFVAVVVVGLLYYVFGVIDDRRRTARDAASRAKAALSEAPEGHFASRQVASAMNGDPDLDDRVTNRDTQPIQPSAQSALVAPPPVAIAPATLDGATTASGSLGRGSARSYSPFFMDGVSANSREDKRDAKTPKGEKAKKKDKGKKGKKDKKGHKAKTKQEKYRD